MRGPRASSAASLGVKATALMRREPEVAVIFNDGTD
jgi:hypothetical protein